MERPRTELTLKALKDGTININPLELVTDAWIALEIVENCVFPEGVKTYVVRMDK